MKTEEKIRITDALELDGIKKSLLVEVKKLDSEIAKLEHKRDRIRAALATIVVARYYEKTVIVEPV